MKKETKPIKFQLPDGERTITIKFFDLEETFIEVGKTIEKYPNGCLLFRKHKFLQTQFITHKTKPFSMLIFNEKGEFVSVKNLTNEGSAPFSLFISDPLIFLLPPVNLSDYENIQSMEITDEYDLLCKNKSGVYEYLYDQCSNKTCRCEKGCRIDDMIFEESYLHDAYLANMRKKKKEENKRPADQDRLTEFMKALNDETPMTEKIWSWWRNRY